MHCHPGGSAGAASSRKGSLCSVPRCLPLVVLAACVLVGCLTTHDEGGSSAVLPTATTDSESTPGTSGAQSTIPQEGAPAPTFWPGRLDPPVIPDPFVLLPPPPLTATPNPLAPYTIPALAARAYGEGEIWVTEVLDSDQPFHRYVLEYRSDGLAVTALANVPHGEGPFPVAIVLHGYIPPEVYYRGLDSAPLADYLAWRGYAALMPDYRGYMETAGGPNPLRIPYAIDVLNLIEALDTLDVLDENRVGVVGHSMGGGAAAYVMVLSERVSAVVLYGSMSADQAANWAYIGEQWAPWWMEATAQDYGSPESNPEGYAQVSPINYLRRVKIPVQLHHGEADDQVPLAWSVGLAERLRERGAAVELFTYPGAGHTFYGPDLLMFHERVFAFFEEHVRGEE